MKNHRYLVSVVVDDVIDHAYKAEILLLTLETFGRVPKENIVMHFVDRVPASVRKEFAGRGVHTEVIPPFLDGKYCNKLMQLPRILSNGVMGIDGVVLMDLDIAVTAPLAIPHPDKICGKVVDGNNPPMVDLERIFVAAGVTPPGVVESDWQQGDTLATNVNGGFVYIPSQWLEPIASAWCRYTEMLFRQPELFTLEEHRIHCDQVGFALAVCATGAPFFPLTSNYNFPVHATHRPARYDDGAPLLALHYHNCINDFGLLAPTFKDDGPVDRAVENVNKLLSSGASVRCLDTYKTAVGASMALDAAEAQVGEAWEELHSWLASLPPADLPKRIILHAGTPKTGTTALQFTLYENREKLLEKGMLYPEPPPPKTAAPKHQFLVPSLWRNNVTVFTDGLKTIFAGNLGKFHTLILSTEGIFNHWHDFPAASRAMLKTLSTFIPMEIWVCFRDPVDFTRSLYAQYLKNFSLPGVDCYGRDMSVESMLESKWFTKHIDYLGFVRETEALFGKGCVRKFRYNQNMIPIVFSALGLEAGEYVESERGHNIRFSAPAMEMLRILNRYDLPEAEKRAARSLVREIESILGSRASPFELEAAVVERIEMISRQQWKILEAELE